MGGVPGSAPGAVASLIFVGSGKYPPETIIYRHIPAQTAIPARSVGGLLFVKSALPISNSFLARFAVKMLEPGISCRILSSPSGNPAQ